MRFNLADELHCANFRRTAQCSCWEGVDERADWVGSGTQGAAHTAHKVNHVAVVLCLFEEIDLHTCAVAAQVVAGKVNKHHVLRVLFRVGKQGGCKFLVLLAVARAAGCSRNGVDVGAAFVDAAVSLGRRAQQTESAEIEIEQIW